ncbi:MAG: glutathione S-transferase family protein [Pseudomonadota bacterium]
MYKLYYSSGAASSAVHWMLIEIGADFELAPVDLERGEQKSPAYLKLNPAGQVPTLVVDGEPFTETAAILMWLAERHRGAGFDVEPTDALRRRYLQQMLFLANTLQPAFRLYFYPQEAAGAGNETAAAEMARARIETAWAKIDAVLADGRAFLLGDRMTTPDFLATMLVRWSRNMSKPATAFPNVAAYVARMKTRTGLKEVHRREGLTEWIGS